MKTILFRGISAKTGRWIAGSLYRGLTEDGTREYHAIMPPVKTKADGSLGNEEVIFGPQEFVVVRYDSIGQYLMDDKNDMPIYEGDIVRQEYDVRTEDKTASGFHIGVVRLTAQGAQICSLVHYVAEGIPADSQPHKSHRLQLRSYRAVVIGNIHEHPHLLKRPRK